MLGGEERNDVKNCAIRSGRGGEVTVRGGDDGDCATAVAAGRRGPRYTVESTHRSPSAREQHSSNVTIACGLDVVGYGASEITTAHSATLFLNDCARTAPSMSIPRYNPSVRRKTNYKFGNVRTLRSSLSE